MALGTRTPVPPADRHHVVVLVLPRVLPLELGIATQIFGTDSHYALSVCAAGPRTRAEAAGFSVTTDAGLEALADAGTVIVPGYEDIDAPPPPGVEAALQEAHARGARVVSICSAAFLLGAVGLLDGREATTHWQLADELQRRVPRAIVRPNRLFVDTGSVLSSAGVTAGIDLCLHLIRRDHGPAAANRRARALVAPPQRLGGQAQYAESLLAEPQGERLAELRAWMLEHLGDRLDIDSLAARAHISRRTLIRHFRADTGAAPMAWLTDARLDLARELLERSDQPIEQLGFRTGLGSPATVRALFHRKLGLSPQEYRAQFRHPGTAGTVPDGSERGP